MKPRFGLPGGVLFKANCQGVPITPNHVRNTKIKEHNIGMMETRAARVEQNTRHKAEPSTHYQGKEEEKQKEGKITIGGGLAREYGSLPNCHSSVSLQFAR